MDNTTLEMQRTVLARLLDLTTRQAQALDTGDIALLNTLSQARANLVRASAAYLPPACDWDPAVAPLAQQLHQASEQLQRDLRDAMALITRDLQELAKREHVTDYLKKDAFESPPRLVWKG